MNIADIARAAFNTIAVPVNLARVRLRVRRSDAIVVHNGRFKAMPAGLVVWAFCLKKRRRFTKPANVAIVLLHDRGYKTLMQRSLEFLGIDDYTVLRPPSGTSWRHTYKITSVLDYLRSGACTAEYVLYADSDDAIMREDPARLSALLEETDCDLLVSSTKYARYHGLAEAEEWARTAVPSDVVHSGSGWIHMNAGVYLARTSYLREFLERAVAFVTDNDMASNVFLGLNDDEARSALPSLPYGSGDDQLIFRYMAKQNFPCMKVDYKMRLAMR